MSRSIYGVWFAVACGISICYVVTLSNCSKAALPGRYRHNDQLDRLLADRPQLQALVQSGDAMQIWLQSAFEGAGLGYAVKWKSHESGDLSPYSSESSTTRDHDNSVFVSVNEFYHSGPQVGQIRSGEEVLSELVFELCNVRHVIAKEQLLRDAEDRHISRSNYIKRCAYLEFVADNETSDVYTNIWLPFCQTKHISSHSALWHFPGCSDFNRWLGQYPKYFWYPWKYYGDRYDLVTGQVKVYKPDDGN